MPELPRVLAQTVPSAPPVRALQTGRGLAIVGQELERVAHVTASIYDAEQRQKVRLAQAQAATDLERFAFELDGDGDYDTHEERFNAKRDETITKYAEKLRGGYRGDFESEMRLRAEGLGMRVAQGVRERRIDAGLGALDESETLSVGLAARAANPAEREQHLGNALAAIDEAEQGGLVTPQQAVARRERLQHELASAELTELTRLEPAAAVRTLSDPRGPYLGTMPEPERQVWLSRATDAHEAQLREQHAARQRAQADYDRAVRIAGDEAAKRLVEQATLGDGVQVAEVASVRDLLTPPEWERWMQVAQGGGRLRDPAGGINAEVYIDHYNRALQGDDIAAEADAALLAGQYGKVEHDTLRGMSEDTRFKDARASLAGALKVGEAVDDPTARSRSAQALQLFEDWIQAHPQATREEAQAKASELSGSALSLTLDPAKLPTMHVPPPHAVRTGKEIDVDASSAAIMDALERGEIDEAEAAQEAQQLQRIDAAQRAQAQRRAPQ